MCKIFYLSDYNFLDFCKKKYNNYQPIHLTQENYQEVLNEIINISLFNNNDKYLIIDFDFFSDSKNKNISLFNQCLNNNHIILTLKKIPQSNFKKFTFNYTYEELNYNLNDCVNDYILEKNINISKEAIDLLIFNLEENYQAIINELNKLSNLHIYITEEIIKENSYKSIKANIFSYTDAKLLNNQKKAKIIYQELIECNYSDVAINEIYFKELELLYSIHLLKPFYNNQQICDILKISSFRLNFLIKTLNKINISFLEKEIINNCLENYKFKMGLH